MKLLTHNLMQSHVKGVTNGYPFIIEATNTITKDVEFNPEFVVRMLNRVNWDALRNAVEQVGHDYQLPESLTPDFEEDRALLYSAHRAMLEIEVIEGHLVCPESGKKFKISKGIPNMLLKDE